MKRTITVLLVEDNFSLRRQYLAGLVKSNFSIICAEDASEIESIINKWHIDIIISDTELKTSASYVECERLLQEGKLAHILIIGLSNNRNNSSLWKGLGAEFLHKKEISDLGTKVKNIYNRFKKEQYKPL